MSKNKDDKNNGAPPIKPVALPSFPKYDDHHRDKWSNDYDKVEAELLKTHVSQPNAVTTTLGLRLLSPQFDRTIPSMDTAPGTMSNKSQHNGTKERPRAHTTEPDESKRFGRLSPIMANSPGRSVARPNSAAPHNVTSSLGGQKTLESREVAQTLVTLLDPPVQFRTSFQVDYNGIDLQWILNHKQGDRPPSLVTLETVREDMLVNPSAREEAALSSPRSVVILLRNGLTVKDLQVKPVSAFQGPGVSQEDALSNHRHHEQRRKAVLASLREEYRDSTAFTTSGDVLDAVAQIRAGDEGVHSSTMLNKTREKQKFAQEINKEKLQKQMEYIDETRKRLNESEMRRLKADEEAREHQRQKREESRKRQEEAEKRMRELRDATNSLNKDFVSKLERRKRQLEEKERARAEAMEAQKERLREETERRQRQRKQRLEQNKEHLERMAKEQEEAVLKKEEEAAERRAQLEREKQARKQHLQEQQALANARRDEARRNAREHELQEMRLAEAKRQHADEKLHKYFDERETERQRHQREEEEKERERQRKRLQAEQRAEERKRRILENREQHEQTMQEIKQHRSEEEHVKSLNQKFSQDDKSFFVQRKARAIEFAKLVSVGDYTRKVHKAETIEQQRKEMLKATLREREQTRLQQERFRQQMESKLSASF